jgi:general secretion pathway protein D
VSRALPAKALIEQLTAYRGSVMIELKFLQLSNSDLLNYGVNLTNSFSIIWSGSQSLATAGATLSNLAQTLRQGFGAFGITALQASVVASLTQSSSRTLLDLRIRAVSGQPSTIHVGEKYPVLTAGYFGPPSATQGTTYTPPPSFAYQDLGVSLKVLPIVNSNDLITMDVESQYQLLQGTSIDGVPVLANRSFITRISIHSDEWAVIGGLMDSTDDKSISGVAGLARIPLLGWLFKTKNTEKDRDHIVIVIKPHIVGDPPAAREAPAMRVGPETRPLSPI